MISSIGYPTDWDMHGARIFAVQLPRDGGGRDVRKARRLIAQTAANKNGRSGDGARYLDALTAAARSSEGGVSFLNLKVLYRHTNR